MATCDVYKNGTLLGAGSITSGSTSLTSFTVRNDGDTNDADALYFQRNVQVTMTSSTHLGSTFYTRIIADNGSGTLTLKDASPFAT